MKIDGACFCGKLAYEADIDENLVGICHCRDCQVFSGSAYRMSAMTAPHNFRVTQGEPRYFDKLADSGKTRRMVFCDTCGSHLASIPLPGDEAGNFVSIRVATAHQYHQLKPSVELYCASRVPWLSDQPGTVAFERMPE